LIKFDSNKYYYDKKTADGFVELFEKLITHPKGPLSGKQFKLEEWQKEEFIRPLFGIKDKLTHKRRFKKVFMMIPKKNGKTPLMAGVLLIMTKLLKDNGSRVVSLASSRDQAKLVYRDMCEMIRNNYTLSKWFKIYQGAIVCGRKSYTPLSADVGTNDGDGCEVVLIDEEHRFKTRELIDLMGSSQASKDQPLFLIITTAGSDTTSICYEDYDYACKVRDGIIEDDTLLPIIYEAGKDDDPYSVETQKKANPNYGISVSADFLAEAANKAKNNASYRNSYLRLHLNLWTKVSEVWITDEIYNANQPELDINRLKGHKCIVSFDLASNSDLTAMNQLFPPDRNRDYYPDKYLSFNRFWLPKEKRKDSADKNNINYNEWVEKGFIQELNGNRLNLDDLENIVLDILSEFEVTKVLYDPYHSIQLISRIGEVFGADNMISCRQDHKFFTEPMKRLEFLINEGQFLHGNNPVLRWCFSNTVVNHSNYGDLIKPDKNTYHQKIDGTVTNIMSIAATIGAEEEQDSYLKNMTDDEITLLYKGELTDEQIEIIKKR